ncbi:MAG: electron transfer flavoprotein subunit alpha [candidate division NC10 bacterium]|nr:electron transfer flavoprotein subunit alpha [candidate division NC10 bacterium]
METILFLGHTESDGSLPASALEALGAARTLAGATNGSTLVVGLVGGDVRAAADGIAGCGAARFLGVSGQDFRQSRYASDAAAVEALCKAAAATLVIAPGTSRWNRVLPGVAQRLGGRVDTHVTGMSAESGGLSVTRWYYRQRMEATLARTLRPWIILLDPGCHGPWQGERGAAKLEAVAVDLSEGSKRTTVTGVQAPPADQQTIRPDAEVLFVAGAGWTKTQADGKTHASEAAELILGFLRKSQASLGGSKSLVDLKGEGQAVLPFMTHLNQVGQTGSTPRHPKGLSTCCHGEEPHVVGWRFVNERRAVNLDPNCGWARGKADVLYVADAFEVMRKVNALLGEK